MQFLRNMRYAAKGLKYECDFGWYKELRARPKEVHAGLPLRTYWFMSSCQKSLNYDLPIYIVANKYKFDTS